MEITPLTPHLGAEIRGVDLSAPLDNETFSGIHQAFLDWSVLVFRDQDLSRDQHKDFGRKFGKLHTHPMNHQGDGDDEILLVKTTKDSAYTAGNGWHTDVTCDEYPPMGSMLYIKEVPGSGGGDTLYANMYLAYEMLSETMKDMLDGLVAVHDGAIPYVGAYMSTPPEGGYPRHEHPVVATHPETGRKLLYVNSGFTSHIKDLTPQESKALLTFLLHHIATTPRLTCRVAWEPNTLTFWDNRCTQHHAIWDYYPNSRYGERVSIVAAERPAA
ncbi:MAG: TauD/TfdA family dioxygenase [Pseudomonadales bacterium]|nr:TauD/TfdA family dioxygenase [Pseudomonadales bacterium]MBO6567014.1 TauD/TfdA family dioxygenase [Pseudomonadales bacterium]MBO6594735.1 TauD/TfdA family dioxygenase [Pseudomonadales bacterium]MBO6656540.1 TauD/TfdA family dioxygenase [Pseudomonadales bacterium]MBO6701241.1 TauD/TfdA family dioxygenase [Pseudomonadales bacterium]